MHKTLHLCCRGDWLHIPWLPRCTCSSICLHAEIYIPMWLRMSMHIFNVDAKKPVPHAISSCTSITKLSSFSSVNRLVTNASTLVKPAQLSLASTPPPPPQWARYATSKTKAASSVLSMVSWATVCAVFYCPYTINCNILKHETGVNVNEIIVSLAVRKRKHKLTISPWQNCALSGCCVAVALTWRQGPAWSEYDLT